MVVRRVACGMTHNGRPRPVLLLGQLTRPRTSVGSGALWERSPVVVTRSKSRQIREKPPRGLRSHYGESFYPPLLGTSHDMKVGVGRPSPHDVSACRLV